MHTDRSGIVGIHFYDFHPYTSPYLYDRIRLTIAVHSFLIGVGDALVSLPDTLQESLRHFSYLDFPLITCNYD